MEIAHRTARFRAGFTLVEVLVTLAVIALAFGLITINMGHDASARLRTESERLRGALEHASALAQWRRADLIFEAAADGYRFLHPVAEGGWEAETDELLAPHPLPAELHVTAIGPAGGAITPRVRLRASGRNDPYTLVLESPAGRRLVRADPLNRVRVSIADSVATTTP